MPSYNFQPVIGSSFDNLAGQNFQWAQLNRAVEEGNLAREQRAAEIEGNWYEQLARARQQAQDRDLNLQLQADAAAREAAASQRAEAERKRQFDVGAALSGRQLEVQQQRYQFAADEQNRAERKQLDQIANLGESLAPDVADAGDKLDRAMADYNKVVGSIPQTAQRIKTSDLKDLPVVYNPKLNRFEPSNRLVTPKKEDQAKIDLANEKLADALAESSQAKAALDEAQRTWNTHQQTARQNGLVLVKQGDRWVVSSPMHKKTWGGEDLKFNPDAAVDYRPGGANPLPRFTFAPPASPVMPPGPVMSPGARIGALPPHSETADVVSAIGLNSPTSPARPQTRKDFDDLQSGDYFINPSDGKLMRKK